MIQSIEDVSEPAGAVAQPGIGHARLGRIAPCRAQGDLARHLLPTAVADGARRQQQRRRHARIAVAPGRPHRLRVVAGGGPAGKARRSVELLRPQPAYGVGEHRPRPFALDAARPRLAEQPHHPRHAVRQPEVVVTLGIVLARVGDELLGGRLPGQAPLAALAQLGEVVDDQLERRGRPRSRQALERVDADPHQAADQIVGGGPALAAQVVVERLIDAGVGVAVLVAAALGGGFVGLRQVLDHPGDAGESAVERRRHLRVADGVNGHLEQLARHLLAGVTRARDAEIGMEHGLIRDLVGTPAALSLDRPLERA